MYRTPRKPLAPTGVLALAATTALVVLAGCGGNTKTVTTASSTAPPTTTAQATTTSPTSTSTAPTTNSGIPSADSLHPCPQPNYWSCSIPGPDWHISQTQQGIDILSPDGLAYTGFAVGPGSQEQIQAMLPQVFQQLGVTTDATPGQGDFTGSKAGTAIRGTIQFVPASGATAAAITFAPADSYDQWLPVLTAIHASIQPVENEG